LKARYVIHAVGPRYGEGNEDEKLRNATLSSLRIADRKGLRTIAIPAISAGIFGFPRERCANVILLAAKNYLESYRTGLTRVIFCLYDDETFAIFTAALRDLSEEGQKSRDR
jgi:O-acetyl-ADP-ribose deacetylase (regulator of RNase III)